MKIIFNIIFLLPLILYCSVDKEVKNLEKQKEIFEKLENAKKQKIFKLDSKDIKLSNQKNEKCIKILKITDQNITLIDESDKSSLYKKYINKCNTITDLDNLTKELTSLYYDKGYITSRVYLRAQNLSNGEVCIKAIEGKVDKIVPNEPYVDVAFFNQEGDFLNLRDIETSLEAINSLSSNNATMKLVPSEKTGFSDIVIENKTSKRLNGSLSLNNFGSKTTGKVQGALVVSLENPLAINDILSLSLNSTQKHDKKENSVGDSLQYSFPLGRLSTTISARRSKYKQLVPAGVIDYEARGQTKTYKIKFDYKLFHDRNNKVSIGSSVSQARSKNYLADTLLETSSYNLAKADFWLNYLYQSSSFYTFASFGYTKGTDWFDSYNPTSLDEKYKIYTLNLTLMQDFSWAKYTLSAYAQYTRDALFSSSQISIGGHYSVRGYQKEGLSGNSGYYVRNELEKTLQKKLLGHFDQTYYMGLDGGWIKSEADAVGGNLLSSTFGLRLSKGDFAAQLYAAVPLHKADVEQTKNFFGASLEYRF